MSAAAAKLLSEFDALSLAEKQEFIDELLRRRPQPDSGVLHDRLVDLQACGISESQAAELRARLKSFAEDWDRPEAGIYDENPPR